jgi:hypothetical protein
MKQLVSTELAGQTEVLGGNLHHCHFTHHKSHMTWNCNWAAAVGSRWLTPTAGPQHTLNFKQITISQSGQFTHGERYNAWMCKASKQGRVCRGLHHNHGNSSAAVPSNKAYEPTGCWTCRCYHCITWWIGCCPFLLRDSQYRVGSSRYGPGAVIPLYE